MLMVNKDVQKNANISSNYIPPSILICDCLLPIDFEIVLVTFKLQDSIAIVQQ